MDIFSKLQQNCRDTKIDPDKLKKLESKAIIKRYCTIIDTKKIGFPIKTILLLFRHLERDKKKYIKENLKTFIKESLNNFVSSKLFLENHPYTNNLYIIERFGIIAIMNFPDIKSRNNVITTLEMLGMDVKYYSISKELLREDLFSDRI